MSEDNSFTWGLNKHSGCDIANSPLHIEVVRPLRSVFYFIHSLKSIITFWISVCILRIGNLDEDINRKCPGSYTRADNRERLLVTSLTKAITTLPGTIKSPGLPHQDNKHQYAHFHFHGHWFDLSCSSLSSPWNIKHMAQSLSSLERRHIFEESK